VADENHVEIDEAAVEAMFSSWEGPVGVLFAAGLEAGEAVAKARVPRDTGKLSSSIGAVHDHDADTGHIKGLLASGRDVFAPVPKTKNWEAGFPRQRAIENTTGITWNRSPKGRPRTRGARRNEPYMVPGLEAVVETIVTLGAP
jgi:hypothetical protein